MLLEKEFRLRHPGPQRKQPGTKADPFLRPLSPQDKPTRAQKQTRRQGLLQLLRSMAGAEIGGY